MGIVGRYDEQGGRLKRGGELARCRGSESGRFALKLHFGLVIVRGRLATANGGGTRESEFALGGGGEGEDVGAVERVGEIEIERGCFVCEENREGTFATINGGGQELARAKGRGKTRKQVFLVEIHDALLELGGRDRWVGKVNDLWFFPTRWLHDQVRAARGGFVGEDDVGQVKAPTVRNKANIGVDQKMRLQEVAAICIDRSVAIDEFELRDRIIHAVNDDLESAVTIDETVLFHVALDYGTQVVDAYRILVGIERGGEYGVLTAVEIDAQVERFPLEVRNGEDIGNGRGEGVVRGIIVESHKQGKFELGQENKRVRQSSIRVRQGMQILNTLQISPNLVTTEKTALSGSPII